MSRASAQQALKQMPVRWAIAALVLLILYAFLQPTLNQRLGLKLPSLAAILGESETKTIRPNEIPKATPPQSPVEDPEIRSDESPTSTNRDRPASSKPATTSTNSDSHSADQPEATLPEQRSQTAPKTRAAEPATRSPRVATDQKQSDQGLLYGILKEVSPDRYVSKSGLQFNPGSEEGHRLKHLERHLKDMPDRPGKHGVFDGDMATALKVIDEAYMRGKSGGKGVQTSHEQQRTIYEVTFDKAIGYVGGRDGNKAGHPPARRLRLVVDGSRFVTAFPF